MLALLTSGPFVDQSSGVFIALMYAATAAGSFFAGRVSFRSTVIKNSKAEAASWEGLYKASKEKNELMEQQIRELTNDGHAKDMKIAALTGKIDVIQSFLEKALGKELTFDSTTTTTTTRA
jgi:hypothetical protein